jgi:hypothetical protein
MAGVLVGSTAVVIATDEATSTTAMRIARVAALSPLFAAVSVLAVLAHAGSRGELRALQSLGVAPARAGRGAVFASTLFATFAMIVLATRIADARSLFPTVHTAVDWAVDPLGRYASAPAVFITANGGITLAPPGAPVLRAVHSGRDALPCVAPIAYLVGPWAVTPMSMTTRVLALTAAGAMVVGSLHLVAADRVPAILAAGSVLPLVVTLVAARLVAKRRSIQRR